MRAIRSISTQSTLYLSQNLDQYLNSFLGFGPEAVLSMKEFFYWGDKNTLSHDYSDIRTNNGTILVQMYSI
jgi:hypothetical protein